VTYFSFTDLSEGLRLVKECLRYAIESGDKLKEDQMYLTLQYLYGTSGDRENALKYLELHTDISKEIKIPGIVEALVKAAYGRIYSLENENRKALNQYIAARIVLSLDEIEERAYISQLDASIGQEYLKLGLLDSAQLSFSDGMNLARRYEHLYGSMINSLGLAQQYLNSSNINQTIKYCDSVIHFGKIIESSGSFFGIEEYRKLAGMSGELYIPMNHKFKRYISWRIMSGACQIQMSIYERKKDFEKALTTNRFLQRLNDSIEGFQKRTEILDLQYRYQTRQKDDQIILLSQKNDLQSFRINQNRLILFTVIAISVLLIMIFILLLQQSRIKAGRKVTEFKQKLLRSQMNPHFIFNSLTSIQHFVIQQDDIKASIYLSRFSDLVRNILSNSQVEFITLEEEINTLENYMELQKIRFPEKFEYRVKVDGRLDPESIKLPPMLTQPFVENAIEHAFKHIEAKGEIDLDFKLKQDCLSIAITDNGIGRQKSHELKTKEEKDHKSMATMITLERIKTINKKLKQKIRFEIIDLKDENGNASGTKVVFEIPLYL
jgi:hypothetical protein